MMIVQGNSTSCRSYSGRESSSRNAMHCEPSHGRLAMRHFKFETGDSNSRISRVSLQPRRRSKADRESLRLFDLVAGETGAAIFMFKYIHEWHICARTRMP